ncbi:C40 family peptidase [Lactobacillaceae bacterium Scapto_B20]
MINIKRNYLKNSIWTTAVIAISLLGVSTFSGVNASADTTATAQSTASSASSADQNSQVTNDSSTTSSTSVEQNETTTSNDDATQTTKVTKQTTSKNGATTSKTTKETTYNKPYNATKKLYKTSYNFYKGLDDDHKITTAKGKYGKQFKISRIAKTDQDTYFKTPQGWISSDAFNQYVKEQGTMNEKMRVTNDDAVVYSAPANTKGAKQLGTAESLGLTDQWLKVNYRKNTNTREGFFRITQNGQNYYIDGKDMEFNLAGLDSHNSKIEKAIKTGEQLIGKSPYSWGGGRTAASIAARRFDCSSFVRYVYAKAGVNLGPITATTFTLVNQGKRVNSSDMKRGDIFFFDDKKEGRLCHVGIYLGRGLFLNDSPSTDTHGVGISSLQDPHWKYRFDHIVRRVA